MSTIRLPEMSFAGATKTLPCADYPTPRKGLHEMTIRQVDWPTCSNVDMLEEGDKVLPPGAPITKIAVRHDP